LKDAAALWRFVRDDPVGRWLGIAAAVVAWFALTWMSLTATVLWLLLTALLPVVYRRRRDLRLDDDLDDLI
jgi:membrane protein implicated in regulation of membrane protease activity